MPEIQYEEPEKNCFMNCQSNRHVAPAPLKVWVIQGHIQHKYPWMRAGELTMHVNPCKKRFPYITIRLINQNIYSCGQKFTYKDMEVMAILGFQ